MIAISAITLLLFGGAILLYFILGGKIWLTLAISFATTCYHFVMRLLVGFLLLPFFKDKTYNPKKVFRLSRFEKDLYAFLKVKRWKDKMPTFDKAQFDIKKLTPSQLLTSCKRAQAVHLVIVLFSFLPILASIFLGEFWVFTITSLCAALIDLIFVVMQRYNGFRLAKLLSR